MTLMDDKLHKVLTGMKCCIRFKADEEIIYPDCEHCPYTENPNETCENLQPLFEDVMDLLSKLKPTPIINQRTDTLLADSWYGECPSCHRIIVRRAQDSIETYCKHCGQAIAWEE